MESKNWSGLGISALISLLECRCHSGVTFWTGGGGFQIRQRIWIPPSQIWIPGPTKLSF